MVRTYVPVDYNVLASWWLHPNKPSSGPPDGSSLPCQLYMNSLLQAVNRPVLRMAPLTITKISRDDMFEIPQGSGYYYLVLVAGVVHLGFPNEHWAAQLAPRNASNTADVFDYPA